MQGDRRMVSRDNEFWSEKMRKRNRLSMLLLAAFIAGASGQLYAAGPTAAQAADAITVAKAALKKAASVQSQWRDSGKLVKKAEAAVKKGDYAKAIKLAARATDEGDMAYRQGYEQRELYIPPYLMSKY
ncbi:MAG: SoxXA-binding protein [Candidatus Sedimenticola sp. (ex Thyasira tokunagai)]